MKARHLSLPHGAVARHSWNFSQHANLRTRPGSYPRSRLFVNASSPKLTAEEAHRTPLQTIFSEMPSHLNTAKAAGQSHVVEFRFPGCDPSLDPVTTFGVVVENGRVQPFFGENQLPRPATLLAKMDRNYYKEIALGATEPGAEAFFKIKMIQGKLFELAAFNGLFETPPTSPHA